MISFPSTGIMSWCCLCIFTLLLFSIFLYTCDKFLLYSSDYPGLELMVFLSQFPGCWHHRGFATMLSFVLPLSLCACSLEFAMQTKLYIFSMDWFSAGLKKNLRHSLHLHFSLWWSFGIYFLVGDLRSQWSWASIWGQFLRHTWYTVQEGEAPSSHLYLQSLGYRVSSLM